MNICIFCASTNSNNDNFNILTKELGNYLSINNTLVYGGARTGLMGEIANSFLNNNGKVIGIIPDIKLIKDRVLPNLSEYIYTKDMALRKQKMIEISDVFIALPGGPGTLDEISEVLDLIRIKLINKPLIIYNMDGYYDHLEQQINKYYEVGFLDKKELELVHFVKNLEEIKQYV